VSATLRQAVANQAFALAVRVDGTEVGRLPEYRGETVWVGCDADVSLPSRLHERWRLELASGGAPEVVLGGWLTPLAVDERGGLRAGQHVTAQILHPDGSIYVTRAVQVAVPRSAADFPQEVTLDDSP